uniref:Secreted protein n=1 Tax=Panagrellus redivivus TaxID=6233 RepID=A0A7E4W2N2_PANRE
MKMRQVSAPCCPCWLELLHSKSNRPLDFHQVMRPHRVACFEGFCIHFYALMSTFTPRTSLSGFVVGTHIARLVSTIGMFLSKLFVTHHALLWMSPVRLSSSGFVSLPFDRLQLFGLLSLISAPRLALDPPDLLMRFLKTTATSISRRTQSRCLQPKEPSSL